MIGEAGTQGSLTDLANYLSYGKKGQNRVEDRSKRVGWESGRNVGLASTIDQARDQMSRTLSVKSDEIEDEVYHLIVSWQSGNESEGIPPDNPTREEMEESVDRILKKLELDEHQAWIVEHIDTDTTHAHVMVNRVHPRTKEVWEPKFDYPTIYNTIRELEQEHGWHQPAPATMKERYARSSAETPDYWETEVREKSVRAWAQDEGLREEMKEASSWAEIKEAAERHEAVLKPTERRPAPDGGLVLEKDGTHVALSSVDSSLSRPKLEDKFGRTWFQYEKEKRGRSGPSGRELGPENGGNGEPQKGGKDLSVTVEVTKNQVQTERRSASQSGVLALEETKSPAAVLAQHPEAPPFQQGPRRSLPTSTSSAELMPGSTASNSTRDNSLETLGRTVGEFARRREARKNGEVPPRGNRYEEDSYQDLYKEIGARVGAMREGTRSTFFEEYVQSVDGPDGPITPEEQSEEAKVATTYFKSNTILRQADEVRASVLEEEGTAFTGEPLSKQDSVPELTEDRREALLRSLGQRVEEMDDQQRAQLAQALQEESKATAQAIGAAKDFQEKQNRSVTGADLNETRDQIERLRALRDQLEGLEGSERAEVENRISGKYQSYNDLRRAVGRRLRKIDPDRRQKVIENRLGDEETEVARDAIAFDRNEGIYELAADYYKAQYEALPESPRKEYIDERSHGLAGSLEGREEAPSLGYAPPEWESFTDVAKSVGYSEEELREANIARDSSGSGVIDAFNDMMVTVGRNENGRVRELKGRLNEGTRSELRPDGIDSLNTSKMTLKNVPGHEPREALFPLSEAQADDQSEIVVTEGPSDALAARSAGRNAVTVFGRTTKEEQADLIADLAGKGALGEDDARVVALLDGDDAGRVGSITLTERMEARGVPVDVVRLPEGKDVDDIVNEEGAEYLNRYIEENREDGLRFTYENAAGLGAEPSPEITTEEDGMESRSERMTRALEVAASAPTAERREENFQKLVEMDPIEETALLERAYRDKMIEKGHGELDWTTLTDDPEPEVKSKANGPARAASAPSETQGDVDISESLKPLQVEVTFGSHEGDTVREVLEEDPGWARWMVENVDDRPVQKKAFEVALDYEDRSQKELVEQSLAEKSLEEESLEQETLEEESLEEESGGEEEAEQATQIGDPKETVERIEGENGEIRLQEVEGLSAYLRMEQTVGEGESAGDRLVDKAEVKDEIGQIRRLQEEGSLERGTAELLSEAYFEGQIESSLEFEQSREADKTSDVEETSGTEEESTSEESGSGGDEKEAGPRPVREYQTEGGSITVVSAGRREVEVTQKVDGRSWDQTTTQDTEEVTALVQEATGEAAGDEDVGAAVANHLSEEYFQGELTSDQTPVQSEPQEEVLRTFEAENGQVEARPSEQEGAVTLVENIDGGPSRSVAVQEEEYDKIVEDAEKREASELPTRDSAELISERYLSGGLEGRPVPAAAEVDFDKEMKAAEEQAEYYDAEQQIAEAALQEEELEQASSVGEEETTITSAERANALPIAEEEHAVSVSEAGSFASSFDEADLQNASVEMPDQYKVEIPPVLQGDNEEIKAMREEYVRMEKGLRTADSRQQLRDELVDRQASEITEQYLDHVENPTATTVEGGGKRGADIYKNDEKIDPIVGRDGLDERMREEGLMVEMRRATLEEDENGNVKIREGKRQGQSEREGVDVLIADPTDRSDGKAYVVPLPDNDNVQLPEEVFGQTNREEHLDAMKAQAQTLEHERAMAIRTAVTEGRTNPSLFDGSENEQDGALIGIDENVDEERRLWVAAAVNYDAMRNVDVTDGEIRKVEGVGQTYSAARSETKIENVFTEEEIAGISVEMPGEYVRPEPGENGEKVFSFPESRGHYFGTVGYENKEEALEAAEELYENDALQAKYREKKAEEERGKIRRDALKNDVKEDVRDYVAALDSGNGEGPVEGYDHLETIEYGKAAVEAREADIRKEAQERSGLGPRENATENAEGQTEETVGDFDDFAETVEEGGFEEDLGVAGEGGPAGSAPSEASGSSGSAQGPQSSEEAEQQSVEEGLSQDEGALGSGEGPSDGASSSSEEGRGETSDPLENFDPGFDETGGDPLETFMEDSEAQEAAKQEAREELGGGASGSDTGSDKPAKEDVEPEDIVGESAVDVRKLRDLHNTDQVDFDARDVLKEIDEAATPGGEREKEALKRVVRREYRDGMGEEEARFERLLDEEGPAEALRRLGEPENAPDKIQNAAKTIERAGDWQSDEDRPAYETYMLREGVKQENRALKRAARMKIQEVAEADRPYPKDAARIEKMAHEANWAQMDRQEEIDDRFDRYVESRLESKLEEAEVQNAIRDDIRSDVESVKKRIETFYPGGNGPDTDSGGPWDPHDQVRKYSTEEERSTPWETMSKTDVSLGDFPVNRMHEMDIRPGHLEDATPEAYRPANFKNNQSPTRALAKETAMPEPGTEGPPVVDRRSLQDIVPAEVKATDRGPSGTEYKVVDKGYAKTRRAFGGSEDIDVDKVLQDKVEEEQLRLLNRASIKRENAEDLEEIGAYLGTEHSESEEARDLTEEVLIDAESRADINWDALDPAIEAREKLAFRQDAFGSDVEEELNDVEGRIEESLRNATASQVADRYREGLGDLASNRSRQTRISEKELQVAEEIKFVNEQLREEVLGDSRKEEVQALRNEQENLAEEAKSLNESRQQAEEEEAELETLVAGYRKELQKKRKETDKTRVQPARVQKAERRADKADRERLEAKHEAMSTLNEAYKEQEEVLEQWLEKATDQTRAHRQRIPREVYSEYEGKTVGTVVEEDRAYAEWAADNLPEKHEDLRKAFQSVLESERSDTRPDREQESSQDVATEEESSAQEEGPNQESKGSQEDQRSQEDEVAREDEASEEDEASRESEASREEDLSQEEDLSEEEVKSSEEKELSLGEAAVEEPPVKELSGEKENQSGDQEVESRDTSVPENPESKEAQESESTSSEELQKPEAEEKTSAVSNEETSEGEEVFEEGEEVLFTSGESPEVVEVVTPPHKIEGERDFDVARVYRPSKDFEQEVVADDLTPVARGQNQGEKQKVARALREAPESEVPENLNEDLRRYSRLQQEVRDGFDPSAISGEEELSKQEFALRQAYIQFESDHGEDPRDLLKEREERGERFLGEEKSQQGGQLSAFEQNPTSSPQEEQQKTTEEEEVQVPSGENEEDSGSPQESSPQDSSPQDPETQDSETQDPETRDRYEAEEGEIRIKASADPRALTLEQNAGGSIQTTEAPKEKVWDIINRAEEQVADGKSPGEVTSQEARAAVAEALSKEAFEGELSDSSQRERDEGAVPGAEKTTGTEKSSEGDVSPENRELSVSQYLSRVRSTQQKGKDKAVEELDEQVSIEKLKAFRKSVHEEMTEGAQTDTFRIDAQIESANKDLEEAAQSLKEAVGKSDASAQAQAYTDITKAVRRRKRLQQRRKKTRTNRRGLSTDMEAANKALARRVGTDDEAISMGVDQRKNRLLILNSQKERLEEQAETDEKVAEVVKEYAAIDDAEMEEELKESAQAARGKARDVAERANQVESRLAKFKEAAGERGISTEDAPGVRQSSEEETAETEREEPPAITAPLGQTAGEEGSEENESEIGASASNREGASEEESNREVSNREKSNRGEEEKSVGAADETDGQAANSEPEQGPSSAQSSEEEAESGSVDNRVEELEEKLDALEKDLRKVNKEREKVSDEIREAGSDEEKAQNKKEVFKQLTRNYEELAEKMSDLRGEIDDLKEEVQGREEARTEEATEKSPNASRGSSTSSSQEESEEVSVGGMTTRDLRSEKRRLESMQKRLIEEVSERQEMAIAETRDIDEKIVSMEMAAEAQAPSGDVAAVKSEIDQKRRVKANVEQEAGKRQQNIQRLETKISRIEDELEDRGEMMVDDYSNRIDRLNRQTGNIRQFETIERKRGETARLQKTAFDSVQESRTELEDVDLAEEKKRLNAIADRAKTAQGYFQDRREKVERRISSAEEARTNLKQSPSEERVSRNAVRPESAPESEMKQDLREVAKREENVRQAYAEVFEDPQAARKAFAKKAYQEGIDTSTESFKQAARDLQSRSSREFSGLAVDASRRSGGATRALRVIVQKEKERARARQDFKARNGGRSPEEIQGVEFEGEIEGIGAISSSPEVREEAVRRLQQDTQNEIDALEDQFEDAVRQKFADKERAVSAYQKNKEIFGSERARQVMIRPDAHGSAFEKPGPAVNRSVQAKIKDLNTRLQGLENQRDRYENMKRTAVAQQQSQAGIGGDGAQAESDRSATTWDRIQSTAGPSQQSSGERVSEEKVSAERAKIRSSVEGEVPLVAEIRNKVQEAREREMQAEVKREIESTEKSRSLAREAFGFEEKIRPSGRQAVQSGDAGIGREVQNGVHSAKVIRRMAKKQEDPRAEVKEASRLIDRRLGEDESADAVSATDMLEDGIRNSNEVLKQAARTEIKRAQVGKAEKAESVREGVMQFHKQAQKKVMSTVDSQTYDREILETIRRMDDSKQGRLKRRANQDPDMEEAIDRARQADRRQAAEEDRRGEEPDRSSTQDQNKTQGRSADGSQPEEDEKEQDRSGRSPSRDRGRGGRAR